MKHKPIFLYGPPGAGKTTVGRILANDLNQEFVDLDERIEQSTGKRIADIFAESGELGFRKVEREALLTLLPAEGHVIALGGGTLLDDELRAIVAEFGDIVSINASLERLSARLRDSDVKRPLLFKASLHDLLERRASHYASFDNRVESSHLSPEEVVREVKINLGRFLTGAPGFGKCDILIASGILNDFELISNTLLNTRSCFVVSDSNVAPLYLAALRHGLKLRDVNVATFVLPAGESSKDANQLGSLWDQFAATGMERGSLVIALGGGVVGDLAGFAAATYMRGLPWLNLPTSLLAMVDASIGGKTGIDRPQAKNLVGAFHSPSAVLIDSRTIETLPDIELRNGTSELLKAAIIGDPELFEDCAAGVEALAQNWSVAIARAVAVKVDIVNQDPLEQGIRATLNFGHTVGHAIEHVSNYRIPHGAAIAIGMLVESRLGNRIGFTPDDALDRILNAIVGLNLPHAIPDGLNPQDLLNAMSFDKKKSGGRIQFALPKKIGHVQSGIVIDDLPRMFMEVVKEAQP